MSGEKEFRRWIVQSASKDWLCQSIETSTGTGIPDLFICTHGYQCWAELKATESDSRIYMRISQYRWFCRLISRGGYGLLLIKRTKTRRVDVYEAKVLTQFSASTDCELKGEDIVFPKELKPAFSYKLGTGNGMFYKKLIGLFERSY